MDPQNGLKKGTRIVADDIHPTFSLSFRESLKSESFTTPPLDWKKAMAILSKVHSLQQMGDYWKLLWELAASCPVPYLAPDAVPRGLVKDEHAKLESYNFSVLVDGLSLYKPIFLKGNPGGYTTKDIAQTTKRIYNRDVTYHGYLVVQEGLQLRPDELRGIMIRIKGIGIGYYDASLLDYRFNEGPRSRWITGEIFVESGLEDALNIDRDSFNRFIPSIEPYKLTFTAS